VVELRELLSGAEEALVRAAVPFRRLCRCRCELLLLPVVEASPTGTREARSLAAQPARLQRRLWGREEKVEEEEQLERTGEHRNASPLLLLLLL